MIQEDFLEQKVFIGLTSVNKDKKTKDLYFSEEDFAEILEKSEYFGISIYDIKTTLDGKDFKAVNHESFRKKATDARWYKREFENLKREQEGLLFAANYKVSKKLLARDTSEKVD